MDKIASRADAVAKMNPTRDSTEAMLRSFGDAAHLVQPQISIVGETRYPSTNRTPNITWVEMLNGKCPLRLSNPALNPSVYWRDSRGSNGGPGLTGRLSRDAHS
jgi:hypothetical protein